MYVIKIFPTKIQRKEIDWVIALGKLLKKQLLVANSPTGSSSPIDPSVYDELLEISKLAIAESALESLKKNDRLRCSPDRLLEVPIQDVLVDKATETCSVPYVTGPIKYKHNPKALGIFDEKTPIFGRAFIGIKNNEYSVVMESSGSI